MNNIYDMLGSSNEESLVFYQYLLDDTENEIIYLQSSAAAENPDKDKLLGKFEALKEDHEKNIARLQGQIENAENSKIVLSGVLKFIENLYNNIKQFIPEDTAAFIENLIAAFKKVIAWLEGHTPAETSTGSTAASPVLNTNIEDPAEETSKDLKTKLAEEEKEKEYQQYAKSQSDSVANLLSSHAEFWKGQLPGAITETQKAKINAHIDYINAAIKDFCIE